MTTAKEFHRNFKKLFSLKEIVEELYQDERKRYLNDAGDTEMIGYLNNIRDSCDSAVVRVAQKFACIEWTNTKEEELTDDND